MPHAPFSSPAERHLLTLLAGTYDEREMECILERWLIRSESPLPLPGATTLAPAEDPEGEASAGWGHAGARQHSLFEEV